MGKEEDGGDGGDGGYKRDSLELTTATGEERGSGLDIYIYISANIHLRTQCWKSTDKPF